MAITIKNSSIWTAIRTYHFVDGDVGIQYGIHITVALGGLNLADKRVPVCGRPDNYIATIITRKPILLCGIAVDDGINST